MSSALGSFEKVLRAGEGRRLKRIGEQAEYVLSLQPEFEKLSDSELRGKSAEFKQRLENGESLEELLFEAYASIREAFRRDRQVELFKVQVMGGIVLHEGDIAEMKTGEGKTFVATQPLFLNSLPGTNVQKGFVPDADYVYDEKFKTVSPEPSAIEGIERALGIDNLYDPRNVQLVNHLNQALKAQSLYQRDVDYVVQDGEVKIVDEFTGRIMEGRRWSEGLHQAVEAKEGVQIQEENVTLATITLQNYFRLYEKLAGMTGTAKTEEKEFVEIYNLHVVEIPTNVPVARDDKNDLIFKSKEGKFVAVMRDIKERHEKGQPVLVGTIAVEP